MRTFANPVEALDWLATTRPISSSPTTRCRTSTAPNSRAASASSPGCADVPVVVITVYEERSFRLRALEAGATDFLHSPVDHHEFVTRARNLLKLRKQQICSSRAAR